MQMCREPAVRKYGIVSIKSDLQALMSAYDTLSSVPLSFLKREVCASQLSICQPGAGGSSASLHLHRRMCFIPKLQASCLKLGFLEPESEPRSVPQKFWGLGVRGKNLKRKRMREIETGRENC